VLCRQISLLATASVALSVIACTLTRVINILGITPLIQAIQA